jgi:hypothetical protein
MTEKKCTISILVTRNEYNKLKQLAAMNKITLNRYIVREILGEKLPTREEIMFQRAYEKAASSLLQKNTKK